MKCLPSSVRRACPLLASCAPLLLACARTSKLPTAEPFADVRAIAREVSHIRRLPEKMPLAIELLDPNAFDAALLEQATRLSHGASADFLRARRVVLASGDDGDPRKEAALFVKGIAGWYDSKRRTLFVQRGVGPSEALRPGTLAHEIGHALVDQFVGLNEVTFRSSSEAGESWRALAEGDANATEVAWRGRRDLRGPGAVIADVARDSWQLLAKKQLGSDGRFRDLENAPNEYTDDVLLPYFDGFVFVAALHRTGGFALVDRAWKHPPETTEQILHPDKYLIGERAIPVSLPGPPPGYAMLGSGVRGEAGIRATLRRCVPWAKAIEVSRGWGGDAYRVLRGPDGGLALVWVIAWDDEPSAVRFEQTSDSHGECWESSPSAALVPRVHVVRRGAVVAVTRGLSAGEVEAISSSLPSMVGARPTGSPPLGSVTLADDKGPAPMPKGRFVDRAFQFDAFGFRCAVPDPYTAKLEEAGLALRREVEFNSGGSGPGIKEVSVVAWAEVRPASSAGALLAVSPRHVETRTGSKPWLLHEGELLLPIGKADEQLWSLGGISRMREVVIPLCGGFRTLVLHGEWLLPIDGEIIDDWIRSFERISNDPPGCR